MSFSPLGGMSRSRMNCAKAALLVGAGKSGRQQQSVNEVTAVPGWKLVPIEPTRQIMSQGHFAMAGTDRGKFRRIYQAMVAAAPEASK